MNNSLRPYDISKSLNNIPRGLKLYRYMDAKYVDEFFADGTLRLSNMENFRSHPEEKLKDLNEGKIKLCIHYSEAEVIADAEIHIGLDCYILCLSSEASNRLAKEWNCNSAIEIYDVSGFSNEIVKSVPNFKSMILDACIYDDNDAFHMNLDRKEIIYGSENGNPEDEFSGFNIVNSVFHDKNNSQYTHEHRIKSTKILTYKVYKYLIYFWKRAIFSENKEFRYVFFTSDDVEGPIIIKSSNLRKFCRKISFIGF